jgi:hypothetical protein
MIAGAMYFLTTQSSAIFEIAAVSENRVGVSIN